MTLTSALETLVNVHVYNLHSREGQREIIEGQNKNIIYRFALTLTFDHETWFKVSAQPFTWKHYDQVKLGERKYAFDN